MRFVHVAVAVVVASGLAVVAVPSATAAASADCSTLLALTGTELCVSVQGTDASVRPGGIATYDITVSVVNGFTTGVTVTLAAQSGGTPAVTSGCPAGNGSAACSIPSLNFLGSPSSYQLSAQVASAKGASAVTLGVTASVALLGFTPPRAAASVPVVVPPAPGSTTSGRHPAGGGHPSGPGHQPGSGRSPGPGGHTSGTGGTGASPGSPDAGGASGAGGSRGAGQDVGAPGPIPLPLDTAPGPLATVGAGNASGMFPQISPSAQAVIAERAAASSAVPGGMPMTVAATVFGILAVLAWLAVALLPRYRRRPHP